MPMNRGFSSHREPYHRDRDGDHDRDRGRDHDVRIGSYFNGGYVIPSWFGPGWLGYPDMYDYNDSDAGPDQGAGYGGGYGDNGLPPPNYGYGSPGAPPPNYGYGSPAPPDQAPPDVERPRRPAYAPEAPPADTAQAQATDDRPGLKLVFWDLRPDQTVHDYLVTRNTLVVLDGGHRREIPLVDIDVVGTREANRDSGVDFAVPTIAK
jgi:hypothetical protein